MKTTLEFNHDEHVQAKRAILATEMYMAIGDIAEELRKRYKYAPEDTPEAVLDFIDGFRQEFYTILENNGIDLEQLTEF